AEMHAGVIESLLDVEDFEAGPRRVEVGKMHRVAVPKAGRVKPLAVVVNHAGAVYDLVPAVAVHVAYAEIVIALSRVAFISFVSAVESPHARQLAVAPVPRGQHRAGVIATAHHQARPFAVEIGDGREEAINAIAPTVAPDRLQFIGSRLEIRRMPGRNVICSSERRARQPVEDSQVFRPRQNIAGRVPPYFGPRPVESCYK